MKKLFLLLVGLLVVCRLPAMTPVPLLEPVGFSCRISGYGGATMIVCDESSTAPAVSQSVVNQTLESDVNTAWLQPGKTYRVNFSSSGSSEYWLSLTAPAGYVVFLDDNPVDLVYQYTGSAGFGRDYKLELHPVSSIPGMRAGQFSGIDVGKAISWEVGLSGLRTGRSAGRILFREKDLVTNAPASRDRLYFSAPGDVGQIELVKDGSSNQVLRQIGTPQCYVDLVDITGGYEMRFYSAISSWTGTDYLFTGLTPWKVIKVENPATNQLKITETEGSVSRVSSLALSSGTVASGAYVFTLQEGDGTIWPRTTVFTSTLPSSPALSPRELEVSVKDAAGTVSAKTKYHLVTKPWGDEEVTDVYANPGASQLTTSYTYYETAPTSGSDAQRGNYRKIKSVVSPTGGWVSYAYYDDWNRRGQLQVETRPFGDSPATVQPASSSVGNSTYHDYVSDFSGRYRIDAYSDSRVTNIRSGVTIAVPTLNQTRSGLNFTSLAVTTSSDASIQLSSTVETIDAQAPNNPDYQGLSLAVIRPDGTMDSYGYYNGSYSSGVFTVSSSPTSPCFRTIVWHGTTNPSGADYYSSFDGFALKPIYLVPNKSTKEVTIRNTAGDVLRTETHIYTGGGNFTLLSNDDYNYDVAGRYTQHFSSNGGLMENFYTNGRLTSTVDEAGTETDFAYDALGRVATKVKKGVAASGAYPAQGDITTTNTYDASGHVLQTVSAGGTLSLTATSTYDLAGRLTSATAPGSFVTSYAYFSGGRIITTTLPGGATKTTENYLDGQFKQVYGSAVVSQYVSPFIDGTTGRKATQTVTAGVFAAPVNTYYDWLGRQAEVWKPDWNGTNAGYISTYNNLGQLIKYTQPGMAATLYGYDTLGFKNIEGLDINGNGTLDGASDDRITGYWNAVDSWDSGANWWNYNTTYTYAQSGVNSTTNNVAQSIVRVNNSANSLDLRAVYDIHGNSTSSSTGMDRANKKITTTITYPDSSTSAAQVIYNGLLMESTDKSGIKMTYGYDALGRQVTATDPRTGATTTAYIAGTNLVSSVTDSASVTQATYTYDAAGRVSSMTNALGKVVRYEYNDRNQKIHEWGDATYPVEYIYDSATGQQTGMKTFAKSTSTFTGSSWPTRPNNAQATTWTYDAATGLLASKTDDASQSVSYTYTQAGQLATRTLARGAVTTYAYSATTGEMTGVTYSDGTPGVTYTYNRLGRVATVADATGTRTLAYNLGATLELQSETLPNSFYGDVKISRYYDTAAGRVGRYNSLAAGPAASPNYSIGYSYESTTGRMNGVWGFSYAYVPNSNLIQSTSASGWNYTDARTYDSQHDWMSSRVTTITGASTAKASFVYTPDAMGRITDVVKTGELFNRYGAAGTEGLKTTMGYNDRSELTSESTKEGTAFSTVLPGRQDAYDFDNLGNRKTTTHNGTGYTWSSNSLNQVTTIDGSGVFDVAGGASASSTVTVADLVTGTFATSRFGQYFFESHAMNNSSTAVNRTLTINAPGSTPASTTTTAFLPVNNYTRVYDADGNMTADARWDYVYDAENQLVSMQTHPGLSPSILANADAQRLEFKYDYLGRRVEKIVLGGYNGTSFTTVLTDTKFVYDGWNVIEELDGLSSNSLLKMNVWGLDATGSLQGAGGVGGLLSTFDAIAGTWAMPMYDAMGNVHGLINAADGSIVAAYEYDAFGNTLRESGTYAGSNPYRYSTKYTDIETGLVYYGLRYYNPSMGRFINKDPIEESGGLNLYAFCSNVGVNGYDYLGMDNSVGNLTWTLGHDKSGDTTQILTGDYNVFTLPSGQVIGAGTARLELTALIKDQSGLLRGGDFVSFSAGDPSVGYKIMNGIGGVSVLFTAPLGNSSLTFEPILSTTKDPNPGSNSGGNDGGTGGNGGSGTGGGGGSTGGNGGNTILSPIFYAPNSVDLAASSGAPGSGKPVFNAGDVAGVLNGTPAGQALLGRLKGELVVKTGDVYVRDAKGNLIPAALLAGGYVKGSKAPGVIIVNNLLTTTGGYKGTDAQFYAYTLGQEANEYDLFWAKTPGNDKAVEVINRVNAENQAAAMGVPGLTGYRTASGAPDVSRITQDVASNPAYNGPTHGGSYILRNGVLVKWP